MISNSPSQRLVKHIIRSYARLTDHYLARQILKENIPPIMKEKKFLNSLDDSSKRWMVNLMKALSENSQVPQMNQPPLNATLPGMNIGMMPGMVMGQMPMGNIPPQQGYMMPQQGNEYGYGMYNENYMQNPSTPKGMFGMPQGGIPGKGYGNVNPFYNYKN